MERELFDPNVIQLGDLVQDRITGIKGIATAKTTWITGCDRWIVQPQGTKDNKPHENVVIDVTMLVIVKKQAVTGENSPLPKSAVQRKVTKPPTGGPRPRIEAQTKPAPKRHGY